MDRLAWQVELGEDGGNDSSWDEKISYEKTIVIMMTYRKLIVVTMVN